MPFVMASCQAVMIGDNVYVGGGHNISATNVVMVYNIHTGTWGKLLPYGSEWFGMAAVNNQLVLVGGANTISGRATNVLGVWDEGSQKWTHPFLKCPHHDGIHLLSLTKDG